MIEYRFSLDSILETPSLAFELEELRIFDRSQQVLELRFYLDIGPSNRVSHAGSQYIILPHSLLNIAIKPWFPRLKPGQASVLAGRDTKGNILFNLTFEGPIPQQAL